MPLYQHVIVGRRMFDLFADREGAGAGEESKVNPELLKVARDDWRASRTNDRRDKRGGPRGRAGARGQGARRPYLPSRFDVVERLDSEGLLPAIVFIFSRVGCDAAVTQCLNANLRLTSPAERETIRRFVEERCRNIPDEDLHVLGYHDFLEGLDPRRRGAPRRDAADLQGVRRGAVRRGAVQGRVRHRDARTGHQHAGPVGGHREAQQVERRDPRRHHAGGVHPADRSCGPARHRRRRSRCRALAAGHRPSCGGRPGLDAHLPAQVVLPAVVQHGGQPGEARRPAHRTRAARVLVRAVPGRQGGRRARASAPQERGGTRRLRRGRDLPSGRLHGVLRDPPEAQRRRVLAREGPQERPA